MFQLKFQLVSIKLILMYIIGINGLFVTLKNV